MMICSRLLIRHGNFWLIKVTNAGSSYKITCSLRYNDPSSIYFIFKYQMIPINYHHYPSLNSIYSPSSSSPEQSLPNKSSNLNISQSIFLLLLGSLLSDLLILLTSGGLLGLELLGLDLFALLLENSFD